MVAQSRDAFEQVRPYVTEYDLTQKGWYLFEKFKDFYDNDLDAKKVDMEIVKSRIERANSNPKTAKSFCEILDQLPDEVSHVNIVKEVLDAKKDAVAEEIAIAVTNARPEEELSKLMTRWQDLYESGNIGAEADSTKVIIAPSIGDLVKRIDDGGGKIELLPKSLNDTIGGGILPGHHVGVFARPDAGKTAFVINLLHGFIRKNRKTLYLGNEDPIEDIIMRVYSSICGMNKIELVNNEQVADQKAQQAGIDNIVFVSLESGTPSELNKHIEKHKPEVVIIDQIRNMTIPGIDGITKTLEEAGKHVRRLGKKHNCAMISITQAGDTGTNKQWLEMSDIDGSKTGYPATLDLLIGIGMDQGMKQSNRRVLSLCKDKVGGTQNTRLIVTIEPQYSRYRSSGL